MCAFCNSPRDAGSTTFVNVPDLGINRDLDCFNPGDPLAMNGVGGESVC